LHRLGDAGSMNRVVGEGGSGKPPRAPFDHFGQFPPLQGLNRPWPSSVTHPRVGLGLIGTNSGRASAAEAKLMTSKAAIAILILDSTMVSCGCAAPPDRPMTALARGAVAPL
jgi:hypothetical protein